MAQLLTFQKDVHRLPERVIKNLDHFLMNEWVVSESFDGIRTLAAGESEGQRFFCVSKRQCGADFIVALRWAESHHNIFGMQDGFEPGPEHDGNIQRGKSALAHDYGMNKFYRDMLRVGRVRTAAECEQAAALEEALRHQATSFRQARRLARKKFLDDLVAAEQALFDLRCQPTCGRHNGP